MRKLYYDAIYDVSAAVYVGALLDYGVLDLCVLDDQVILIIFSRLSSRLF